MLRRRKKVLVGVLLFLLAGLGLLALQIDDWSRDLTTNYAATSAESEDPGLRSQHFNIPMSEIREILEAFVADASHWDAEPPQEELGVVRIPLTRTTRFFKFVDDVEVIMQATETGAIVDITSRSRVGKGDLGQNPRNIREIMQAIRSKVEGD